MLSTRENERLTRVGPGAPMGMLLRRYWHPVAVVDEMRDRWERDEDLPERVVSLVFGGAIREDLTSNPHPD